MGGTFSAGRAQYGGWCCPKHFRAKLGKLEAVAFHSSLLASVVNSRWVTPPYPARCKAKVRAVGRLDAILFRVLVCYDWVTLLCRPCFRIWRIYVCKLYMHAKLPMNVMTLYDVPGEPHEAGKRNV